MVSRVVSVLDVSASCDTGTCTLSWGEVSVVEKVVGYKKIKFHTHENAGYGDVRLPDMQMHTTAFWVTLPASAAVGAPLVCSVTTSGWFGFGSDRTRITTVCFRSFNTALGR